MAFFTGTNGADRFTGGSTNDTATGADGADTLAGGSGADSLSGELGDDRLDGGSGEDALSGGHGLDDLKGGSGNDSLSGDDGSDTLDGGAGADALRGGLGDDRINGGSEGDTAYFSGALADYQIVWGSSSTLVRDLRTAAGVNEGQDTLIGIERLQFSDQLVLLKPNRPPTTPVDASSSANQIAEGAANGTLIGLTAASSDPNGDAISYRLVLADGATALNNGRFAIDPTTGVVSVFDGSKLDFETAASHQLVVRASDGWDFRDQTFTVAVTNRPPTSPVDSDAAANWAVEGAANGSTIGLVASAQDPSGGTITFSLLDDAEGRFAIDPLSGVVTIIDASRIDFAEAASHEVVVRAADASGAHSADGAFTINVAGPPSAIEDIDAAVNQVPENSPGGTLVGITAHATDPAGGAITYSLTNDADGRFDIDPNTGEVRVADGALIDADTSAAYDITVRATNAQGVHGPDEAFLVGVVDMHDFLTGKSVGYQYAYSQVGPATVLWDAGAVLVNDQIELNGITAPGELGTVDIRDHEIVIHFDGNGHFQTAGFNGIRIFDVNGDISNIFQVELVSTNVIGLTQQNIGWTFDQITVNFEGRDWIAGDTVLRLVF